MWLNFWLLIKWEIIHWDPTSLCVFWYLQGMHSWSASWLQRITVFCWSRCGERLWGSSQMEEDEYKNVFIIFIQLPFILSLCSWSHSRFYFKLSMVFSKSEALTYRLLPLLGSLSPVSSLTQLSTGPGLNPFLGQVLTGIHISDSMRSSRSWFSLVLPLWAFLAPFTFPNSI